MRLLFDLAVAVNAVYVLVYGEMVHGQDTTQDPLMIPTLDPLSARCDWIQRSDDIDGEFTGHGADWFGYSVGFSRDGTILAIGAPFNDGNGPFTETGQVKVFERDGAVWSQLGNAIVGGNDDQAGWSVKLSSNGAILAIGATDYENVNGIKVGRVQVFQFDGIFWNQMGDSILGEAAATSFGWSIDLSGDGLTLVIGSPFNDSIGPNAGRVSMWKYDTTSSSWSPLGNPVDGEQDDDYFGYSVAISADSTTLALGAHNNAHVHVLRWDGASWSPLGGVIDGQLPATQLGNAVAISADGTTVAVAANDSAGLRTGRVRVYQFDGVWIWNQIGAEIDGGTASNNMGQSVSISDDGTTVALGARYISANGSDAGHVRVMKWEDTVWHQVGNSVDGESSRDVFGHSVVLSGDGQTLAVGGPLNDGNGNDVGHVRVLEWDGCVPSPTPDPLFTPTLDPLSIPTQDPLMIPTADPLSNGYPDDWEIVYNDMIADFSATSMDELSLNYDISADREYETSIFQRDCETPITDIDVILTSTTRLSKTEFHDTFILSYDIDKASIAISSIWDAATNQIEICQVVRLIVPASDTLPRMVINEDERVMSIEFNMSVDFQFDNGLLDGSVGKGSGSTDVDSYVQACKCDGVQSFSCDDAIPLLPNEELFVCIRSVSPDVEIDFLDSMIVSQEPETTMGVIENNQVQVPSITSRSYIPGMNGVAVSTRVPPNLFSFGAGQSITITGGIEMKLVESELFGRNLLVSSPSQIDKMASYEIKVYLIQGMADPEHSSTNSASSLKNMGFIYLGVVMVLVYTVW